MWKNILLVFIIILLIPVFVYAFRGASKAQHRRYVYGELKIVANFVSVTPEQYISVANACWYAALKSCKDASLKACNDAGIRLCEYAGVQSYGVIWDMAPSKWRCYSTCGKPIFGPGSDVDNDRL